MSRVLLVPDLTLEHWPSMDRYAAALARRLEVEVPGEAAALGGSRYLARYVRYPRALRRYRPALVHVADHSYAHCLRAFPGVPSIVTIHDLYPLSVLGRGERGPRALLRDALLTRVMAWVRRATSWIAGSEFTASEAAFLLGLSRERMTVIGYGVDETFFQRPSDDIVAERRRGWLGGVSGASGASGARRVVLHVGTSEPRKNVEAAILALGWLRQRGVDAVLVQIGGRFTHPHHAAIEAAGVEGSVRQETGVDESALVAAYYAADALVLPSTYEGFGLPALEAQAAGLPVVHSGAGGLAEAAGDAALTVTGAQPVALADALARALTDQSLREDLIARGRSRARRHTWDGVAAKVRAVYDEALGGA
jgi:glycosyltransferase involved in cell wall biosynthesis